MASMNTNLSEAFLFASGTLGALFLLLVIALIRNGVEGLARIWAFVGPLLGGLISAVTTSYFAEARVDSVKAEAGSRFAAVATNVGAAINKLEGENAQLRTAVAHVGTRGGFGALMVSPPAIGDVQALLAPLPAATPAQ